MGNPSTLGARVRPRLFIGLCSALAICSTIALSAAFSGHVYTSVADGTVVNQNIFASKPLVYINGGPQNDNSSGLPNGTYYFQVTDPSGATLLSEDNAVCRQLLVSGGVVAGAAGPCPHANGSFNPANGSTPVQVIPFLDTPNSGGEYKVWLIPVGAATIDGTDSKVLHFDGGNKKTDNFKVDQGASPTENEISGTKFYDANVNGTQDPGELGIPGWHIEIDIPSNTTTDADGNYIFLDVPDGTYEVCEVIPALAPTWIPTTPTSIAGITVPPDSPNNDFGNVCRAPAAARRWGSGRTRTARRSSPPTADWPSSTPSRWSMALARTWWTSRIMARSGRGSSAPARPTWPTCFRRSLRP